jgi:hypothetical protein
VRVRVVLCVCMCVRVRACACVCVCQEQSANNTCEEKKDASMESTLESALKNIKDFQAQILMKIE